jgi:hypothetical protein
MSSGQGRFWDVQDRLRELSAQGDPLEKLATTVDFELFRADLTAALGRRDRSKGGRPGFDPVLRFRMLVLQALHGLSLAQTEYLVADSPPLCIPPRRREGGGRPNWRPPSRRRAPYRASKWPGTAPRNFWGLHSKIPGARGAQPGGSETCDRSTSVQHGTSRPSPPDPAPRPSHGAQA